MAHPAYIAGAIFDIDETLLDNQPEKGNPFSNLHQLARLDALRVVGATRPELGQLLEIGPQENYDSFIQSPVHTAPGAFHTLLQKRGILTDSDGVDHPLIQSLIKHKNSAYAKLVATSGRPVAGADTFVRDLAERHELDRRLAIASSATYADISTFLTTWNLADLFPDTRIISGSDVAHPKPHPEAFNRAFASLGLPEDARRAVIALEDDPRGMLSARQAGLYVCGITTRYTRQQLEQIEAKPDLIVDSYAELRDAFGV